MTYRLLITDIHGTAAAHGEARPTETVRRAARAAHDSGLVLAIATGISRDGVSDFARDLSVFGPCVVNAGSQIVDVTTKELLYDARLSVEELHEIAKVLKDYPFDVIVDGEVSGGAPMAQRINTLEAVGVLRVLRVPLEQVPEIKDALSSIGSVAAVEGRVPGRAAIVVTPHSGSKGPAVKKLMELYAVDASEVVSVGDAGSDVPMFEVTGLSVALANATTQVQQAAKVVAPPVAGDGLAWVLDHLRVDSSGESLAASSFVSSR